MIETLASNAFQSVGQIYFFEIATFPECAAFDPCQGRRQFDDSKRALLEHSEPLSGTGRLIIRAEHLQALVKLYLLERSAVVEGSLAEGSERLRSNKVLKSCAGKRAAPNAVERATFLEYEPLKIRTVREREILDFSDALRDDDVADVLALELALLDHFCSWGHQGSEQFDFGVSSEDIFEV